jgi:hypothetical protein
MTYTVSKPSKDAEKAIGGSLKVNAKLYELLEKYDEKIKNLSF